MGLKVEAPKDKIKLQQGIEALKRLERMKNELGFRRVVT